MSEIKEVRVSRSRFSLTALLDAASKATLVVTPRDGRCGMKFCLFVLFVVFAWAGILSGRPNLDRRTSRVLNRTLRLKKPICKAAEVS